MNIRQIVSSNVFPPRMTRTVQTKIKAPAAEITQMSGWRTNWAPTPTRPGWAACQAGQAGQEMSSGDGRMSQAEMGDCKSAPTDPSAPKLFFTGRCGRMVKEADVLDRLPSRLPGAAPPEQPWRYGVHRRGIPTARNGL